MVKKKTKVANRRRSQKHEGGRRPSGRAASGGGGGGTFGGMRSGFRSMVGRGDGKKGESSFWNVVVWVLLAAVLAFLLGRAAC